MNEAVDVALRPILVERQGVFLALKGELREIGAVSGEEDGRALKIGVDLELCLVNERNENVAALVLKDYDVAAESCTNESSPIAVFDRNYVFDICIHKSYLTKFVKNIIYFFAPFVKAILAFGAKMGRQFEKRISSTSSLRVRV